MLDSLFTSITLQCTFAQHHSNTCKRNKERKKERKKGKKTLPESIINPKHPTSYHTDKETQEWFSEAALFLLHSLIHTYKALKLKTSTERKKTKKITRRSHRGLHCFLFRNVAVPHRHERTQENFPSTFTGGNIEGISLWWGLILSSVILCIESIRWITQHPQNNTELRLCVMQLFCEGKKKIVCLFSTKVFSPKRTVRNYKYIYIFYILPVTQLWAVCTLIHLSVKYI